MRNITNGMSLALAITVAVGFGSCSDESMWDKKSNETGSIRISLTTDSDINTEKPVFRSGDEETRAASGNLASYITVPTPEQFSIHLEKADGSFSKTWSTLSDFQTHAASERFTTGAYTLTAYYGEKGKQDFESPYFEASTSFTVLSDQTNEVELTAELKNSMVKVNYTDNFKNYMSAYHSTLRTDGRNEEITYNSAENRPAFIEPKNANLTVHFTTAAKGQTTAVSLGEFAPLAKTMHNVTLDIAANQYGEATLSVTFDSSLTNERVEIDLSDDILLTPPPVVTCDGFASGDKIDMLEGSASKDALKMNIRAKGIIAKAEMTVTDATGSFRPAWCSNASGSNTSANTIDLCSATGAQQAQLESAGIKAIGLYPQANPNDYAILNLTECGKAFTTPGEYTISLIITDKNGAVSETQNIVINTLPIEAEMVGSPTILYGSGEAVFTMAYNGFNPETDITFTAVNAYGTHEAAPVISCEEVTATRSFEKKNYIYTIRLPYTTKSSIEIKAFHHGSEVGKYAVPVVEPRYTIAAVDAFAHFAYIKIETPDNANNPSVLAAVTNNIKLKANGALLTITDRDPGKGIVTVTGLATAGSNYTIDSSCIISNPSESWNNESKTFATESESGITNGDFSTKNGKLESGTINVGGEWYLSGSDWYTYQTQSSFSYDLPSGWATINDLTAYKNSNPYNTWYVVPSSWVEHNKGYMRNVGYSHNGEALQKQARPSTNKSYCKSTPTSLVKTAGELFLGTYSYNGSENRVEGTAFASRPSGVSFDYIYKPIDNSDEGYASVEVIGTDNSILCAATMHLAKTPTNADSIQTKTINLDYDSSKFGVKAKSLKVKFKSSYQDNPPIYIPTGDELDEGLGAHSGNKSPSVGTNKYHAVATGSILKIDNVTTIYGTSPNTSNASQSPKRSNKPSKKTR